MAQPVPGQNRFVGVLHSDGGFTFGDPTNPIVLFAPVGISADQTTAAAFVDTTSGSQDQSNPPLLGQTSTPPANPNDATLPILSPTDMTKKPPVSNRVVSFVSPQPDIADLKAAPTEADFNKLLAVLRAAGVLKV